MSRDHLLLIIGRWKNHAYELTNQLESMKNDYHKEYYSLQQKLIELQNQKISMGKDEDLFRELLTNIDSSSVSDQLTVLCQCFVDNLNRLLLSKRIERKEQLTINCLPIIETIQTNIKHIGNLIHQINQNCSNEFNKNQN